MRDIIHNKVFWLSSLALAFFIPVFGRILPLIIIIMVLNWLINGRIRRNFAQLFSQRKRQATICFALFYLLYVVGLLNTSNFSYAWFDLEVKMSLFIFPLVFATSPWPLMTAGKFRTVLVAFVLGCTTGSLIFIGHATYIYLETGTPGAFYYTALAWYAHTSYLSMYYNFALGIALFLTLNDHKPSVGKGFFTGGILVILVVMVLLLSSKAGLITLTVVLLSASLFSWMVLRKFWHGLAVFMSILIVFMAGSVISPVAFSRISDAEKVMNATSDIHRITPESNADRLIIWSTALEIIRDHPWFGVGTGDVKDALLEGYRKHTAVPALQHRYNAHSQYLQTIITLGFPGFLILGLMFLLPAIHALKAKLYIYLLFIIIFAMNTITESMLEVQAGVIFYAFFNVLLFTCSKNGDPVLPGPPPDQH